jgi:ribose transport system substrate-binding protein
MLKFHTLKRLAAIGLAATAGVAAGCGSDSGGGGSAGGGGGAKGKEVAVMQFGFGFEFVVAINKAMEEEAKRAGMKVRVLDANADANQQVTQMQGEIARRPDAINVVPVDSQLIVPAIQAANRQNIPVFATEIEPTGGDLDAFVGFDDVAGGKLAAEYFAETLPKGAGTVLELRGSVGAVNADRRNQGFAELKKLRPDIKIVTLRADWLADKGATQVADAFTKYKDVKGIFSHNDEMVRGVVSALNQVGRNKPAGDPGHVLLVGLDGTPLALDRIRKGVQDATVEQPAFDIGQTSMRRVVDSLEGKKLEPKSDLPGRLISKENVDDPDNWGNKLKG